MPNRIVREGVLTSEAVDALSTDAELFYRRLMSVVDDFGLFHANVKLIRAACYPLRLDRVSDDDVRAYIDECRGAGLVRTPTVSGKQVLVLVKFGQQVRAKASKYLPNVTQEEIEHYASAHQPPDGCTAPVTVVRSTCVADAQHMRGSAHLDGDGDGDVDVDGDVDGKDRGRTLPAVPRSPGGSPPSDARGSRLPDGFPDADSIAWCQSERPTLNAVELSDKFRDYWAGVPGQRGRKSDWPATWRNFVRSEFSRAPPSRASPSALDRQAEVIARITGRSTQPTDPRTIDVEPAEPPAPPRLAASRH
jgi:hypothetical protein